MTSTQPSLASPRASIWQRLPSVGTVLTGLLGLRVMVATFALWRAALMWDQDPSIAFVVSIMVLIVYVLTFYGFWVVHGRRTAQPTTSQLYAQAVADLLAATTLVHVSGGDRSAFSSIYVVLIATYTLLMSFGGGLLITVLSVSVYLADIFWGQPLPPDNTFIGQAVVFAVVFAVVSGLASRLKEEGRKAASLQTELARVRLEADDILRTITSGVLTVDALGRLVFINPMAERMLGLPAGQFLGRPALDTIRSVAPELGQAIHSVLRAGRRVTRAEGMIRTAEREFPVGLSVTTLERDREGSPPSVTAIFADISESKRLQELHLRAERLEAVAELSASLAHEIRNPLASIRSSVEQLSRSSRASEDERFLAQLIMRESDRLSRLLSEFLDFSRVRITRSEPLDLLEVARSAARLVREHPDCREEVTITVDGEPAELDGDEDLLHRVVANLLLNAVQAAKGPAAVHVSCRPATPAELPSGSGLERAVRLEIRDNGPGIPAEVRERLFEPFVTGRVGGSGLGLSIVQRAVEAHRGLVLVDTGAGRGTTFTIYLPVHWATEEAA
ncbi:MAG TPA: ATP-binding protein [Gemmatimonadales bacterium]|nr:ATP-binding protein [Gemmatimonadales bacterium]